VARAHERVAHAPPAGGGRAARGAGGHVAGLPPAPFVCTRCGATATPDPHVWRCPACGGPFELPETPIDPGREVEGDGVWRYRSWLPVARPVSIGEPTTPLATAIAALARIELDAAEEVVVAMTGTGLKTPPRQR